MAFRRDMDNSAALFTASDTHGNMLVGLPDGNLTFTSEPPTGSKRAVILRVGGAGQCLLEAPGIPLRIDAHSPPTFVIALRLLADGTGEIIQNANATPLSSWLSGYVSSALELNPTHLVLDTAREVDPACMLAGLPPNCTESDALTRIIATGNENLLPAAKALLELMDASQARTQWNAQPRGAPQDAFYSLMKDHAHQRLGQFGSYTARILAEQIRLYDWEIGTRTYGAPAIFEAGRGSKLVIGRFCSMANPAIILGNHATRSATSYPFLDMWAEWPGTTLGLADHVMRDVRIGNDVWIGVNAILLPGTEIGDGAVIGAGCVVRGTIPPYAVCTGNPAQIVRYRFAPDIIGRLLQIRWWDWSDSMIDRFIPLLLAEDISRFLEAADAEAQQSGVRL